jgi:hypothetical protein
MKGNFHVRFGGGGSCKAPPYPCELLTPAPARGQTLGAPLTAKRTGFLATFEALVAVVQCQSIARHRPS